MVRNEKDPRGDSIAERYGSPVTVSDVEDLLYREHVPTGTIYKVMQAVRQAVSWHKAAALRPWAGDLEDGLTRQHQAQAEQRRARLAEELREEGRRRAAAAEAESINVNSPALNEVLADAWAGAAEAAAGGAPGSHLGATLRLVQGGAGTITPPAIPEAPRTGTALPAVPPTTPGWIGTSREVSSSLEPIEVDVMSVKDAEMLARLAPAGMPMVLRPPAVSTPPLDAPARRAAPPRAVAAPAPGTTAPPAIPEAAGGLSEVRRMRACTKCGREKPLDEFQKDRRASDGRRTRCRVCSAAYDATRRDRRKLLRAGRLEAGLKVPEPEAEAVEEVRQVIVPQEAVRASEVPPEAAGVQRGRLNYATFKEAVQEYYAPEVRSGTVVLMPRFRPPEQADDVPEGMRVCTKCGPPAQPADNFYTRADGRSRSICAACERTASADRRRARKVKRDSD